MIGSIFRNVLYTCKRKSLVKPRQDYLNQQSGWLQNGGSQVQSPELDQYSGS